MTRKTLLAATALCALLAAGPAFADVSPPTAPTPEVKKTPPAAPTTAKTTPATPAAKTTPATTAAPTAAKTTPATTAAPTASTSSDTAKKPDETTPAATTPAPAATPEPTPAPEKKSDATSTPGYHVAYDLIYKHADYVAGIAALRGIGQDDDASVATLVGFASRKLGDYGAARYWYERALAADPTHVRTWQYYGMWHAEQGNRLKAQEFLTQIAHLCGGTACKEYTDLKGALDGTVTY